MDAQLVTADKQQVDVGDEIREAFEDYAAYDAHLVEKYGRTAEWDALPGEKAARQRKFNRYHRMAEDAGHDATQLTAKLTRNS